MSLTEKISSTVEVAKCLNEITSSKLSFAKEALKIAVKAGESITPFLPLIGAAATLITEIVNIYETSQYNRKICGSLLDRARLAEVAIDQLIRRREDNEANFKSEAWHKAFDRFVGVLRKIKAFAEKISNLRGIKAQFTAIASAKSISEKFKELTTEYDTVMRDLNFAMVISNEQQRKIDHESVKNDLSLTNEFLKRIEGGVEEFGVKIDFILEEVQKMSSKSEVNEAKRIDKNKLTEPLVGAKGDTRGSHSPYLKKKIYMGSIEVACLPVKVEESDPKLQRSIAILIKATQSPNVIQFYGLSNVDSETVLVLEWAEHGNLREYYLKDKGKISWESKLNYALDICRGIAYLNALDIYHHDVRCKNVVVTGKNVAKLTNFDYARGTSSQTTTVDTRLECCRWLAPEKFRNPHHRYDHKCEIFSFGMLLWELAFEREPYEDLEIGEDEDTMTKISDFVTDGGREEFHFGPASPKIADVQKGFEKIITGAWNQDPDLRTSISKLLIDLDTLAKSFAKTQEVGNINSGNSNKTDYEDDDFGSHDEPLISLKEGIEANKKKDFEKAWKCFKGQAKNQSSEGKYWMAYYLWEGLCCKQDKMAALKLYKEAADDGLQDAQFRYASGLMNKEVKLMLKEEAVENIKKYLQLAAKNGSAIAQFKMGEAYSKGGLGYDKNLEIAKIWYKRAAINNYEEAEKKLKELGTDVDELVSFDQ